jgi:hypothetical protein
MQDEPTQPMGTSGGSPDDGGLSGNAKLAIGGLVAVIVGLIVGLVAVTGDGGDEASTVDEPRTVVRTVTTPTTMETTPETTPAQTTPAPMTEEPSGALFSTPRAAARDYARRVLGISRAGLVVNRSPSDPSWAIVTYANPGRDLPAVWVNQRGDGWVAVAGTTGAEAAPDGLGIPDEIRQPYSD